VLEVAYERHFGRARRLSEIFAELLFAPLGMAEAAFFLADGDPRAPRVPRLYGLQVGGRPASALLLGGTGCA
jgi:CubicO group peptidase (beta-lactamase class C family)